LIRSKRNREKEEEEEEEEEEEKKFPFGLFRVSRRQVYTRMQFPSRWI